jgi:hypothetical protein
MGMTASQARLLSITARLSDNEHLGQSVSFAKQRLADQTDYIQTEYNAALSATKLTVLTGFVGSEPQYTDISYNLMTGAEMAQNTRQYVVTDVKGRILVSKAIADAFVNAKGDYNRFLAGLGQADPKGYTYSQSDIPTGVNKNLGTAEQKQAALEKIHEAWDRYFVSVGLGYGDNKDHDFYIGWSAFTSGSEQNTAYGGFPYWQAKQSYTFQQLYKDQLTGNLVAATPDDIALDILNAKETFKFNHQVANGSEYNGDPTPDQYGRYLNLLTLYKDPDGTLTTSPDNSWDTSRTSTVPNVPLYARIPITEYNNAPVNSAADLPDIVVGNPKYVQNPDGGWYEATQADIDAGRVSSLKYTADDKKATPINYDGTTQAQRELYDYAIALTAAYYSDAAITNINNNTLKTAADPENLASIKYYQNIYNEMLANGFFTYGTAPASANVPEGVYLPYPAADGNAIPNAPGNSSPRNTSPLVDNNTFEKYIREGKLQIKYYSATERKFINTSVNEDQGIQEVKDERKIAMAEAKYQLDMRDLERKDKTLDVELKKLDTEHNTLQTEYDSIKGIISKNIEKTFSMFS